MWSKILEEARSSWLGENNQKMLKMCDKLENLMESKIHLIRISHRHGTDVLIYKQEHNPTAQELRAIEISFAKDYDENLDSINTEYQGYHTVSELLSFKSIEVVVGHENMTKTNVDYDGDALDEDLDADDVAEAQKQDQWQYNEYSENI